VTRKYRVLFHGLSGDEEVFEQRMLKMNAPVEAVSRMIREAPLIMKEGMTWEKARQYAGAVQEAGGRVSIEEQSAAQSSVWRNSPSRIVPFQAFTMCPRCGLKQPRAEVCGKCGASLQKART